MKNKIWERVVERYKDEESIKKFLVSSILDVAMVIGVIGIVALIKIFLF